MYISNKRRDKKYGPQDIPAAKEAGMQDKTEFENKVSFPFKLCCVFDVWASGFPLCTLTVH